MQEENQQNKLNTIFTNLNEITKPFTTRLLNNVTNLTQTEIRIAKMVKDGKTSKEIAAIMNISDNTVKEHNHHIRKKLVRFPGAAKNPNKNKLMKILYIAWFAPIQSGFL